MQCKTSEANGFQFERPLWYMQKLLAMQYSAEVWKLNAFQSERPLWYMQKLLAVQCSAEVWKLNAFQSECPIELLPASCIPSGMPAQLAVQKSHWTIKTIQSESLRFRCNEYDVMDVAQFQMCHSLLVSIPPHQSVVCERLEIAGYLRKTSEIIFPMCPSTYKGANASQKS